MKKSHKTIVMGSTCISIVAMFALLLTLLPLMTKSNLPEVLTIEKPYAFATPEGATTAAAFMVLKNDMSEDERLLSVRSNISEITEIHQNVIDPDDGTMMMRKINGLDIPSKKEVKLDPKGYHIMFVNLNRRLNEADYFKLFLTFEKAGTHEVAVFVTPIGGTVKDVHAVHDNHGHNH